MPISTWRRLLGRICFSFFLLCTPLFVLPTSAQSSVVIGEVQWAGSESSSADEWIELWNLNSTPFSLSGYRLRGVGSGSDLVFGPQDQIEPLHAFLIANYNALDPKSTLTIPPQVVTTTISITNENTHITLIDPQGAILDEVSWTRTAPGGSNVSPRSALLRTPDHAETANWISATSSQNLTVSAHQYGTPGFCDGCVFMNTVIAPNEPPETISEIPSSSPVEEQTDVETPTTTEVTGSPTQTDQTSSQTELEEVLHDAGIDPDSLNAELEKELSSDEDIDNHSPITYLPIADAETLSPETQTPGEPDDNLNPDVEGVDKNTDATTTSTATVIETATSTSSIDSARTNNETTSLELTTATTSREDVLASNQASTTNTVVTVPAPLSEPTPLLETINPPINPPFIRKNRATFQELFPSPSSGAEWIELSLASNILPTQLIGWSIRDEKKNILNIQNTTLFTWNEAKRLVVFTLAKNKLTNSGTHLFLVDPLGQIEDEVTMPAIPKNRSWALKENSSWEQTLIATLGEANEFKAATIVGSRTSTDQKTPLLKSKNAVSTKKISVKTTTPKNPKKSQPKTSANKLQPREQVTVTSLVSTKANKNSLASISKKMTKKQSAKKTATKSTTTRKKTAKTSTEPQSIDLKDIGPMYASTRVRLTGTVATLPRLLGSNAFVIQTDDGRGLYVSGNSKQPSPPFRAHIALTGTLTVNDDGLILHMYASDRWTMQELERAVQVRVPDLDHPSLEDAWSSVQVRGIVTNVTPTRVTILHDQSEIFVSIRPVVFYRAERLKKGDEIEVSGLLDTRKDSLTLLPRLAEEIRLVRSAATATSTNTAQSRPPLPWMPIGAAGMSIAVTQGARRYWKHRLEKKIRFSQPN
jgi:hypothetical protein